MASYNVSMAAHHSPFDPFVRLLPSHYPRPTDRYLPDLRLNASLSLSFSHSNDTLQLCEWAW